ncbi:RNA polymerase sigma factor [Formosa undariae]|uniref:RNA polymerase sigma factor n=1 Tax=Formosa undariae TaxID=1325436 RepID=A0ABV5F3K6_9FLAO
MREYGESAATTTLNIGSSAVKQIPVSSASHILPVKMSDALIWKKLREGDKLALGELYDRYVDVLFSYGMYYSKDRGYVMDCIHDLYVDLYKYRSNLSKTDNVKYYLFKSLKRKINKKYNKKNNSVSIDDYDYEIEALNKNHTDSFEKSIIIKEHTSERNRRLKKAINTLSEKQREILLLRFEEEKTYEEISEAIGVTVQSARTSIYRAIKALRKLNFIYMLLTIISFLK